MRGQITDAHKRGIVHRDLKPANINWISGWRRLPNRSGAKRVGMIMGTAAYTAPERARGRNVDKRADVWAFGVVSYEFLTGVRRPSKRVFPSILAVLIDSQG